MRRFRVYDTLTRETRLFVPRTPPRVGLFVCGLTPYADAHIGHAKTMVTFDVVARALARWGYRVFYVQNVTNVDDRLITRGGEEGVDPLALAERHFSAWMRAMDRLGVRSVNYYPRATDYVPEVIEQVQALLDRGFAYAAEGSVYFDVARFPAYGRLSGQRVEALRAGARVDPEPGKRAPEDFVLWKAARPGEPTWESPFGPGRPGWHIEDTAITVRLFGPRYDLHGGGVDLKFPHHEAEIAQAEGATGASPLVNYWMHVGMLTLRGEKMSKSLGNVVGLLETLDRYGPMPLRLFYLNAQYRSPLDFTEGRSLEEAREAFETLTAPARALEETLARSPEQDGSALPDDLATAAEETVERLDATLAEDFNTREAIAAIFQWGRRIADWTARREELSADALATLDAPYAWAREVLGLGAEAGADGARVLDPVVGVAIEARRRARARGDYAEADRIRAELAAAGVELEDHGPATRWSHVRDRRP